MVLKSSLWSAAWFLSVLIGFTNLLVVVVSKLLTKNVWNFRLLCFLLNAIQYSKSVSNLSQSFSIKFLNLLFTSFNMPSILKFKFFTFKMMILFWMAVLLKILVKILFHYFSFPFSSYNYLTFFYWISLFHKHSLNFVFVICSLFCYSYN